MVGLRSVGALRRAKNRPKLHCMAGAPLAQGLEADASHLERFSPQGLKQIWDVLAPCLTSEMSPQLERALSQFCTEHEVPEEALGRVIRALTTLFRGAASTALPKDAFALDLGSVWPGQTEAHDVLLARYDEVIAQLRDAILKHALTRHGNVLADLDWRIDSVMGDGNAPRIALPVAIITMTYENRHDTGHLTLQLTPDELRRAANVFTALAEQTARLLPPPEGGTDGQDDGTD